jgi:tetratricopeptide (TPR) repeat protein
MIEQEMIEICNKEIFLNPENASAFKERGTVKADLGEYEEALKDYNKAIEINPSDPSLFFNRGSLKVDMGDITGAIKDFKKSFELDVNKSLKNINNSLNQF